MPCLCMYTFSEEAYIPMKNIILKLIMVLLCWSLWMRSYSAADLFQVYQDASKNDPVFQTARSTYLSRTENIPIARSDLLTNLTFVSSVEGANVDLPLPGPGLRGNFLLQFYGLAITQPLFNQAAWKQLKSVKSEVKAEYAILNSAAQDLMFRTAQAYFAILEVEDILVFTQIKKVANDGFLQQSIERYEAGLDSVTTVYEAQAEYDQAIALEIRAENDVINKRVELRQLTDKLYTDLAGIKGEIPLMTPQPNDVNAWVDIALEQNYNIQTAKYSMDAARENISVQRAGGSPTVDAIITFNYFDGLNTPPGINGSPALIVPIGAEARGQEFSVGLLAIWPLVQGGRVLAQTRQARYDYETAKAILEYVRRETVVNTEQSYNNIITSINLVKADKQSIKSGETSLESVDALFKAGMRTIVDVLVSQQSLFNAQLDYVTNIYSYILETLQLKYAAGTLSTEDILQINSWLDTHHD